LLNLKHETSSSFARELDVLRNILVEVSFLFLTPFYLLKLYSAPLSLNADLDMLQVKRLLN